MSKTLHPISVCRWQETGSAVTFAFELQGSIEYYAGQHVTLELTGIDEPRGPSRPFTLSSSPTEGSRLAITMRMTNSSFKTRLTEISERGALGELKMRGPMGDFKVNSGRAAVMIAGWYRHHSFSQHAAVCGRSRIRPSSGPTLFK